MEDDVVFAEDFTINFRNVCAACPLIGTCSSSVVCTTNRRSRWLRGWAGCVFRFPPSCALFGERCMTPLFSCTSGGGAPVDRANIILQKRSRSYCFIPHLAWVDDSYSDAQGLPCTHWYIRDSMALGGERMKAVEKRTAAIIPYRETGNRDRSVRNLRYVAQCYGQLFSVLIVEQNERPHLKREALPPGCEYAHGPGPERQVACVAALDRFAREKDYFIVSDANVVCTRTEMRASLIKCAECDAVGSFATYLDLDEADSDLLLSGREYTRSAIECAPGGAVSRSILPRRQQRCARFAPVRLLTTAPRPERAGLRIFDSPGSALCLSQAGGDTNKLRQEK